MTAAEHVVQRDQVRASMLCLHRDVYPARAGLDGPSRRITVEPVEIPDTTPREEPAPEPVQVPEKEPVKV